MRMMDIPDGGQLVTDFPVLDEKKSGMRFETLLCYLVFHHHTSIYSTQLMLLLRLGMLPEY